MHEKHIGARDNVAPAAKLRRSGRKLPARTQLQPAASYIHSQHRAWTTKRKGMIFVHVRYIVMLEPQLCAALVGNSVSNRMP